MYKMTDIEPEKKKIKINTNTIDILYENGQSKRKNLEELIEKSSKKTKTDNLVDSVNENVTQTNAKSENINNDFVCSGISESSTTNHDNVHNYEQTSYITGIITKVADDKDSVLKIPNNIINTTDNENGIRQNKQNGEDDQNKQNGEDDQNKQNGEDDQNKQNGEDDQNKQNGEDDQNKQSGEDDQNKQNGEDDQNKQNGEDDQNKQNGESEPLINKLTNKKYSARYFELLEVKKKLPAWSAKKNFLKLFKRNNVLIIVGDTGSGKTTQISQFILESKVFEKKSIAVTQPRRVAAMSVAARVSEELDVELGTYVGYTIRFEDRSSNKTIIKYLTDGMLLRESIYDPMLSKYNTIILDEAHERTLSTDILFGLIKNIQEKRNDLKLIVMSATLDADKFQNFFNMSKILKIPGRLYPVEIFYTVEAEKNYIKVVIRTVYDIHINEEEGDILVFLTGEEEIEMTKKELEKLMLKNANTLNRQLIVLPLYSSLPSIQQQKIFEPAPGPRFVGDKKGRKCILATNIAETSITIDGIVYVIDPGFSKQKVYNPRARVESLLIAPISKASAQQRAGRAGRTKPGKCFRLYTEKCYEQILPEQTYPEILRSNLGAVVLNLKKLGIDDLVHFDFIDPPAPETLMRALEQLNYLGALDDEGELTTTGHLMSEFPVDPQLAKVLVESPNFFCSNEILTIAAMLSVPYCFLRPKIKGKEADDIKARFLHLDGDHLTLLNVFHAYMKCTLLDPNASKKFCYDYFLNHRAMTSAQNVRNQLLKTMEKLKLKLISNHPTNPDYYINIRKALLKGYYQQVAYKTSKGYYITVKDIQIVTLHPSSVFQINPEWVIYHELLLTSKNFLRTVTKIDGKWLLEIAKNYYSLEDLPNSEAKNELRAILKRS
uniref:ATP-dependent RNA helicase DHX15 n=1 Tax=Piliocolobus tephrosceles TaxID=591936 RepID=A0A8C9GWH2_9PRIM